MLVHVVFDYLSRWKNVSIIFDAIFSVLYLYEKILREMSVYMMVAKVCVMDIPSCHSWLLPGNINAFCFCLIFAAFTAD